MKRYLSILLLFIIVVQISEAQDLWKRKRFEVVAAAGTTQFFCDIGGYSQGENILGFKDLIFSQTRFNVQGGLKFRIIPSVSAKLGFTYGMLHASDEKGSNESRGFEVTTNFLEPVLTCEYAFIKSQRENSYLFEKGRTNPFSSILESLDIYALTGIGGLSFKVDGNEAYDQNATDKADSGFAVEIPVGIGANLLVFPDFNFGIELCGRYVFSDYVDGYSSEHSNSNDVFYTFNFTFTYKIPTSSNGLPSFLSKKRF